MMIFDVNSSEFWQIFARQRMRNLRNPQLERGEVCIDPGWHLWYQNEGSTSC